MKIIIVRHGEAVASSSDEERNLTEKGKQDIAALAGIISKTKWNVAGIYFSPILRTRQTAEIIAKKLFPENKKDFRFETKTFLRPGVKTDEFISFLESFSPNSDCHILIFHSPDVMDIASILMGADSKNFYFPQGGCAAFNLPPRNIVNNGLLVWALNPDITSGFK